MPASEYTLVPLTNLDGSGYLRGDWANVVSETGKPVSAKTGYVFTRHDDGFEQVMAANQLGHPGTALHPEPRLRLKLCPR